MNPTYYRGCWHVVSRSLFSRYFQDYSPLKEVYDPKTFILHAVSLHQTCVHCAKFPTAASRRSMGRVSVPSRLIILSDQLPVIALVSRYLTNKLIGVRPLPKRPKALIFRYYAGLPPLSRGYPSLGGKFLTITLSSAAISLDLHVLGALPTLILSQDQTLQKFWSLISSKKYKN